MPLETLASAKQKLSSATSLQYDYLNLTNTTFNDTKYNDTVRVKYFATENSHHGFGLVATHRKEDYVYDGHTFHRYDHSRMLRIEYDTIDISSSPSYFEDLSFFYINPLQLMHNDSLQYVQDTILHDLHHFVYASETTRPSMNNSGETVRYQDLYYINSRYCDLSRIDKITIRNQDTLQISENYFQNLTYNLDIDQELRKYDVFNYQEIQEEDDNEEFSYTPIAAGSQLSDTAYTEAYGKEVRLFGNSEKNSLIMFSFIGCFACEQALVDFKRDKYQYFDMVNLFYASHQDKNHALKNYKQKKQLPHIMLGNENKMLETFSTYHSPTFVLISPDGKILSVTEGYDLEIKKELYATLQSL